MLPFALSILAAHADPSEPTLSILTVRPAAESLDVPIDTRPAVGFQARGEATAVVRLTAVTSGEVLVEETIRLAEGLQLVTLDPGGQLLEGTNYLVDIIPEVGQAIASPFTTGSGLAMEVPAPHIVTGADRAFRWQRGQVVGGIEVSLDRDTSALTTILVLDAGTGAIVDIGATDAGDTEFGFSLWLPNDSRPSESCVQVIGVDLAGREVADDIRCFDVGGGLFGGCDSASGPMAAMAVGLALALGLTRRR